MSSFIVCVWHIILYALTSAASAVEVHAADPSRAGRPRVGKHGLIGSEKIVGRKGGHHQGENYGAGLPFCTHNNTKLHKMGIDEGTWVLLGDGSFRFEMSRCRLRRFTHQQAKKCLANEHIVFMGDSLSRYIYLSLAHLLSQHTWGQKWAKSSHPEEKRSILWEHDFTITPEDKGRQWSSFFETSSGALNKGSESMEMCDCFRADNLPFYNDTGSHQQQSCFENRHYRYTPKGDLDDKEKDVRLSYIQWYGHMPMRGFKDLSHLPRDSSVTSYLDEMGKKYCPPDSQSSGARLLPYSSKCANYRRHKKRWDYPAFFEKDKCKLFPAEEGQCLQFEREVLGPMNATSLIANIGWHSPIWQPQEEGSRFLQKLSTAAKTVMVPKDLSVMESRIPSFTWRSSTSPAVFHDGSDDVAERFVRAQADPASIGFWDVWTLTEPLYAVKHALEKKDEGALRAAFARYRMEVSPKAKGRAVDLTVPSPFLDHAHYEPYVYAEINNVFLNAVCPL